MAPTGSLDNFVTAGTAVLTEMVGSANELADKLVAAGSKDLLLHQFRDDAETEDEHILKYRAWFNAVSEEIIKNQAIVEKYIVEKGYVSTEPIDEAAVTAQYKDLAEQIRNMRKTLSSFPGADEFLKEVPELKSAPGTGRGGSASAGIPRPRFAKIEYRIAGTEQWIDVFTTKKEEGKEDKRITNLTVLSQLISKDAGKDVSVSAKDIQAPLYEAAGTQDLSTTVEFVFTAGDKNYEVRVSPKV